MKRFLLAMSQPPGCNGVQAVMFAKLLPYLEQNGWEFHFAGPDPSLSSVITEELDYPLERLHYTTNISPSRIFSIRKNKSKKGGLGYYYFAALQFFALLFERLTNHNGDRYLEQGIADVVGRADARWNFDLIGGVSPGFSFLEIMSRLAAERDVPFFAIYTDPHGARLEDAFYPAAPELQKSILEQSCGVFFTSPITRNRYVEAGLVSGKKAFSFTESYPESSDLYVAGRSELALRRHNANEHTLQIVYLGMWPEWRPAEPFLDAVKTFIHANAAHPSIELSIYGYLYPAAHARINADPELSRIIRVHPSVSYSQSHWLAEDSDLQLVMIGPRHLDNYPSKFFDYLAHRKPVLVLGPHQNPLRTLIQDLQIGLYADGMDSAAIGDALLEVTTHASRFRQAFADHQEQWTRYGASAGAQWICQVLDSSLERASLKESS